ncbi:MAG: glycerophosphodiester phosphodiesterase [Ilumatobacteraceae bacterium]
MQQRLPSLLEFPIAFAHRGARAHAPENTMEAFELALKLGANGLESDVWLTSDGVPVLDHDGIHRGKLRRQSLRLVQRSNLALHIPDFRSLLDMSVTAPHISLDLKDFDVLQPLMEQALLAEFPLEKLWLCHYEIDKVLEMKRRYPTVRVVDSSRLSKIKDGIEKRAALLAEHQIDALNMHISDWSGGLVTLLHRFNVLAFGWDAQFPPVLENAYRMGLDGVYSDHVDRLVDAYQLVVGVTPH